MLIDINYKNSSTGKIVYDLSNGLLANGDSVRVLYGRGKKSPDVYARRIASLIEVYFHAAMTRLTGLTGFFSYFATLKAIREIEKFKPDVIHLHELHGYYINFGKLLAYIKKMNIPIVWTFHCEFAYTGKCGHAYSCISWQTECGKCPQLRVYPSSIFFDFTKYMQKRKKMDFLEVKNLTIVTPSKWLADRVGRSFLKSRKVEVVFNGVDNESVFFPQDYGSLAQQYALSGKKIIVSVAPDIFSREKGGRWVLDVARGFSDQFVFFLIGAVNIPKSLPSNVIVIKKTDSQTELAQYYTMADLLLLTSEKETFSLVTAEALSCGTPVIGFESGAPTEIAPEGYGYFVPYGDTKALSKAVKMFFSGELNFKSSQECRDFAVEKYSKNSMISEYMKVYEKILN